MTSRKRLSMTLWRTFSNSGGIALFLAGLIGLGGCAGFTGPSRQEAPVVAARGLRIAVLPVNNLSRAAAPLKDLRQAIIGGLKERGAGVLAEADLEKFMARHRLRYTGGIDADAGRALKEETGADAVLISALELYNESFPPKISLTLRLVSTAGDQRILWIDGRGLSGEDSPGILGLGLVTDPRALMEKAVHSLLDSLVAANGESPAPGNRFKPLVMYRSTVFNPALKYRVAVIPFYDLSGRRNAGEIVGLEFVHAMAPFGNFELIEPGTVAMKMLRNRIILDQGLSLAQADILFETLQADLILCGTVFTYEDAQGALGAPSVEFSAQLMEKKSREVVWSSFSRNAGDDGVFFFDAGKVSTVQALAMRMARLTVGAMLRE
ncbi:MAG TPA: hypothetical protein VIX18_08355 [Nitrospirota bacterium]